LAQRIVRAKAKIRAVRIPYEVPSLTDLPDRLDSVLRVVYLVFNEGYSATAGGLLTRHDLSAEAIRIGRLLIELLPEPEALGLLALMLLHESRCAARSSPAGDLILLEDQDRSRWNRGPPADPRGSRRTSDNSDVEFDLPRSTIRCKQAFHAEPEIDYEPQP
jgi:RNA polymerase sigma-70 factor (ECF subfamily)